MQNHVSNNTQIYNNFSFHFLIYFSYIFLIFLRFHMPIFVAHLHTMQLSHLQWLLVLSMLVRLVLLVVSSFSNVSGLVFIPQFHFIFPCSMHTRQGCIYIPYSHSFFIFIFIFISVFIFISYLYLYSFYICIHIHFIFPCIPHTIPQLHVTVTIHWNALVIKDHWTHW